MEADIVMFENCCKEVVSRYESYHGVGLYSWFAVASQSQGFTSMHVSKHEDNIGALVLAEENLHQFPPRSKYYAINIFWLCEKIQKAA